MAEEFKPKPLKPGEKYLILITEQPFFKDEYGRYLSGKIRTRIEVREKKGERVEVQKI